VKNLIKKLKNSFKKIVLKYFFKTFQFGNSIYFGKNISVYDDSIFFCSIDDNSYFRGEFNFIFFSVSPSAKQPILEIGKQCFFNLYCSISVGNGKVSIGNNCLFGENVKIYNHNHIFNKKDLFIFEQGFSFEDIIIGNNVWIGSNVLILKGAQIEDNCVISAGSIVKEHIAKNSLFINGKIEEIRCK